MTGGDPLVALVMERAPGRVWCRIVVLGPRGVPRASVAVGGTGRPDVAAVGVVARWVRAVRRAGVALAVCDLADELAELLALAGLLGELSREPEDGEHPLGVEEGIDRRDVVLGPGCQQPSSHARQF